MTKRKEFPEIRGRKPWFKSVEQLENAINSYFKDCPDKREITLRDSEGSYNHTVPCPTITGLALHLGFCSRQSMYDYEEKPEFTYTIKKARTFIEREYEKLLHNAQCTGAIFALKNMGWNDKTQQEITGANGGDLVQKVYITPEQQKTALQHINDVIKQ